MFPRNRISPVWGILGGLLAIVTAAVGLLLVWPQALGLQRMLPFAQVVSFRAIGLIAAGVALLVAVVFVFGSRQTRALFGATAAVLTVMLAAGGFVYVQRGLNPQPLHGEGTVRVLSWNTLGNEPGSPTIANLAVELNANVVTLPETTHDMGVEIANLMKAKGHPMWVLSNVHRPGYRATETTLLVSPELGEYERVDSSGDTSELASVVARPTSGDGPTLIAAHPIAPVPEYMDDWRADLDWLSRVCTGNAVLGGDLNATIDHLWGLGEQDAELGECADAGLRAGAASVGTWSSGRPTWMGPAIDHVMATPQWQLVGFQVITTQDRAGSDHRPIFAAYSPRT